MRGVPTGLLVLLLCLPVVVGNSDNDPPGDQALSGAETSPRICGDPRVDLVRVQISVESETLVTRLGMLDADAPSAICAGSAVPRGSAEFRFRLHTSEFSLFSGYHFDERYGCSGTQILWGGVSAPAPGCSIVREGDGWTVRVAVAGTAGGRDYDFRGTQARAEVWTASYLLAPAGRPLVDTWQAWVELA